MSLLFLIIFGLERLYLRWRNRIESNGTASTWYIKDENGKVLASGEVGTDVVFDVPNQFVKENFIIKL